MIEFICIIIGILIGGLATLIYMSCLQINRINKYQIEINKLKNQLNIK